MSEESPPYDPPLDLSHPTKSVSGENGIYKHRQDSTTRANRWLHARIKKNNQGIVRTTTSTPSFDLISEDEESIPLEDHGKDMTCVSKIDPTAPMGR